MAPAKTTKPTSSVKPPNTPPPSPAHSLNSNFITSDHVQQFLDILEKATERTSSSESFLEPTPSVKDEKEKGIRDRASKLDYMTVIQVYNKDTRKYEFKESCERGSDKDDEYEEYLFVHCRRYDSKNSLEASFVDVKSTKLRDILRKILEGVTCINLREDKPEIPPDVLFTYLPQLESYRQDHEKSEAKDILHLDKLIEFLKDHYAATSEKLKALREHGEITFQLLPMFFRPQSLVFMVPSSSEQPTCFMFESGEIKSSHGEKGFEMRCHYLVYDGKSFGETTTPIRIPEFHGVKKITSLAVYPLEYHATKEKLVEEMIERGRKYIDLIGIHYRSYKGQAFWKEDGQPKKFHVSGRVMIDAVTCRQMNPNYFSDSANENRYAGGTIDLDLFFKDSGAGNSHSEYYQDETKREVSCSEGELLLCCPTVFGFCLSTKRWAELPVANLQNIDWDSSAFNSLVIPEDKKHIIQSLVDSYADGSHSTQYDDIIRGKGQSLVILLHGPPGVGKTLTAEGASEMKKMPLYNVCAGDLGHDAAHLEKSLLQITSLAQKWKAIILIDEADVYLAQRSLGDTHRNGLVSVFLRHLEYFSGLMFLTTNRVSTFDEAFQSRIHFAMRFDNLSVKAKKSIWRAFLKRADQKTNKITDEELGGVSRKNINGRQIRNSVRTAMALATWKAEPLSIQHLCTVVDTNEAFEGDFKGVGPIENMNSYT